jgi:hypothetical protein
MTLRYQNLVLAVDATTDNSKKHKPFRIMEIGVFDGAHGKAMIDRAHKNGRTNIEYYGFDLFEDMTQEINQAEVGKKTLARAYDDIFKYLRSKSKAKAINLFKGDTKKTLPETVPHLLKMDIIFIDGGHSLGTIQSDFEHSIKLAHDKTVILLDDYYPGDYTKGCAFIVDTDLSNRPEFKVEILDQVDVYAESGLSVRFAKVTKVPGAQETIAAECPSVEQPAEAAIAVAEVIAEPISFQSEDSVHNTDVQPAEVRSTCSGVGTCEYTGQPCDGGGRCQPRVDGFDLEKVPKPQVDIAPIPEERQEPNQELELGVVESQGVAHTNNGSDEQRRDIPEELASADSERPSKRARRSRRSRNKLSGPQTEATDSEDTEGLQDNG